MTTQVRIGACDHADAAVCFLCSNQRDFWRDARVKAGYGPEPPNAWLREIRLTQRQAEREAELRRREAWYVHPDVARRQRG